jgi:putative ABC transport system permease protein
VINEITMSMQFWTIPLALILAALLLAPLLYWDKGRRSLFLALRSLWLHKLRSFLSVLGIIIGTAAVIALMAFGEGSMHEALEDIKRLGATNIIVRSVKPPDDANTENRSWVAVYGLTYQDYDRFHTLMDDGHVIRMVPMRIFPQEIRRLGTMHRGRVVATTPEYAKVNKLEMALGRFLKAEDGEKRENVCVLGASTAQNLFPFDNPLGQTVRLHKSFYRVVGVVRERMPTGGTGGSQAAEDFNHDAYIPLETARVRYGERIYIRRSGSRSGEQVELSQVTLTVRDLDSVRPTGEILKEMLKRRKKKDWALTVPLDRLEAAEKTRNRFKKLLVVIGGISLFVGGIGIMNIMLATVTERTREIGIRRALGAKRRDITVQFLVEAVVQTGLGGILGALVGLGIVYILPPILSWLVTYMPAVANTLDLESSHLPAKLHIPSIFVALGVAVTVGVLFGWYPARRAAHLDPIEALRHE